MVEGRHDVPPDASDGRGGEDRPRLTRHPLDPGTERRGGAGGVSYATRRCVGCGVEGLRFVTVWGTANGAIPRDQLDGIPPESGPVPNRLPGGLGPGGEPRASRSDSGAVG